MAFLADPDYCPSQLYIAKWFLKIFSLMIKVFIFIKIFFDLLEDVKVKLEVFYSVCML